jgi:elongation factor G
MHSNKQNAIDSSKQEILVQELDLKISKRVIHYVMRRIKLFLNQWTFPDPVIGIAIEPKTQADVDKLGMAMAKLMAKKIQL